MATYGAELLWDKPEDIRNNNYQALIAGADAVGYYAISDGVTLGDGTLVPLRKTPFYDDSEYTVWDKVVEFGSVEKELAFNHFVFS